MNPQDLFNFCKSKTGKIIIFGGLFAAGLIIFSALRKHHANPEDAISAVPLGTNSVSGKPQVVQSLILPMQPFHPSANKPEAPSSSATLTASSYPMSLAATGSMVPAHFIGTTSSSQPSSSSSESLTPISLFADSTAGVTPPKKLSATYAPFGRLISCETIITVDSSSMQTPIIGLVTENVYFGGRLIIPAGTEIHGTAQTDRQRDRIATSTSWKLVWQDGEEMQLRAVALDREFADDTNNTGWAITDGSTGLRGEVIKSDNLADLKLFAATFLSGAAGALTEKQQTIFGPVNSPTLNNAPFVGAQAVLQTYAEQIQASIQKDGFYVRVPSGKQFYLYVLQTIDRADASIGGEAIADSPETDEPIPTKTRP